MEIIFVLCIIFLSSNGRYILVDLSFEENEIGKDAEKERTRYQSRVPITYPKQIPLTKEKIETCQNEDIKAKKPPSFYIDKQKPDSHTFKWVAMLDPSQPKVLGFLVAEKGMCNDLKTYDGSFRCGIAKTFLVHCLKDDEITEDGGINPLTYWNWDDKDFGPTARDVCKSIVLISCVPDKETPKSVCASYMDAARNAGYHMVFVDRNEGQDEVVPFRKLRIKQATALFKQDPQSFLDNVGRIWFFCKCKQTKPTECLGLHDLTPAP